MRHDPIERLCAALPDSVAYALGAAVLAFGGYLFAALILG